MAAAAALVETAEAAMAKLLREAGDDRDCDWDCGCDCAYRANAFLEARRATEDPERLGVSDTRPSSQGILAVVA